MRVPIRARLTVVSAALMAGVLMALGVFVFARVQGQLTAAVDAGLASRADILLARIEEGGPIGGGVLVEGDEAFAQLLDAAGRVVDSSNGLVGEPLIDADDARGVVVERPVSTVEEVIPARLLAVTTSDGGTLVVGASLEDVREALDQLLAQLLIAGPVAIALASLAGWVVAGAALRPVERLRVEAEAISGSETGRRLAVPPAGDELTRLAESLNRMLGRLDEAVERERRFVGDASHELRTPLANLKAELELALRHSRTEDEHVAALRSAADETDRLISLAEDLLVLARAHGGRLPIRRERTDLSGLVRDTVDHFNARAAAAGIPLQPGVEDDLLADVDPARIRQALGNLIDNALRHAGSGGTVRIAVRRDGADIVLEVADTGRGFDPSFVARAFEPLSRADAARSRAHGGSGLGLAIVRAVAEAHGGSVRAENPAQGGASVVLRLPGALT